jgi:hypothetical protein
MLRKFAGAVGCSVKSLFWRECGMRYRNLRIAWSVGWGLPATLLCVLWVRSYSLRESAVVPISRTGFGNARSQAGKMLVSWTHSVNQPPQGIYSEKIPDTSPSWAEIDEDGTHLWTGIGFKQVAWRDTAGVVVPYWAFVCTICAIVLTPWLRFSLRTLLIATTLVAAVLGLAVWAAR